jgi:hypothetical protein
MRGDTLTERGDGMVQRPGKRRGAVFFMVINVHVCVYQRTVDWSKEPLACSVERIACT